jgi:hypothetical protein
VDELVWDEHNEPHLTRRKPGKDPVTRAEVDAMYAGGHYTWREYEYHYPDGTSEWQTWLIGRTPAGRLLTVVCQRVESGSVTGVVAYRPVTARTAEPAEVVAYREDFPEEFADA